MEKNKRQVAIRINERRPAKPPAPLPSERVRKAANDVPPPTYSGPMKTDTSRAKTRGTRRSKPPVGKVTRPRARSTPIDLEDQVPPRTRSRTNAEGTADEQYIRLQVRVRGDQL